MRLLFRLSPNLQPVPFDYQQNLAGWMYNQLGDNSDLHDGTSLYSLSDLARGSVRRGKLDFEGGSTFFLSSYHDAILVELMRNLFNSDTEVAFGMKVEGVDIQREPHFGERTLFWAKSPVLVRVKREDGGRDHVIYDDPRAGDLLTRTLHTKQRLAGLPEVGRMYFQPDFENPRTKLIKYKGVQNRASLCPVVVEGGPEVCSFAWNVGAGHSTGIGFGALDKVK